MTMRRLVGSLAALIAIAAVPQTSHADEEIIVTGRRLREPTWSIMEQFTYTGGYDGGWSGYRFSFGELITAENGGTTYDPCAVADEDFEEKAEQAKNSGRKVTLIGEDHKIGESNVDSEATQYPGMIDTMLEGVGPWGGCVAFEIPSYGDLPTGYQAVANYAASRNVQTYFIDGGGNPSLPANDVGDLNARDAYMANFINQISFSCQRVIGIVGMNHLRPHTGSNGAPVPGRVTLMDQLGATATPIDGREKEACQP